MIHIVTHAPLTTEEYPPVTEELLAELVRRIRSVGSPLKILLFGSQARGTARPDSDIDIMVIEEADCDRNERFRAYNDALEGLFPDWSLAVHTMEEVALWQNVPNQLISETLKTGKLLFEDRDRLSRYYADGQLLLVCEGIEPKTPADLARQWFCLAEDDFRIARLVLAAGEPYLNCCFHVQQAVEKYLKGFLQLHGFPTSKSHDLDSLRWHCRKVRDLSGLASLRLKEISEFIYKRYELGLIVSKDDAQSMLAVGDKIREIILEAVPPEARP